MSAQDEQHLYSLPYDAVPMASHNYNDLENMPKINNVTLRGELSLSDLGIPTKTSELTNDAGFITESDVPTKTSELTNDSDFTTKTYVDDEVSALEQKIDNIDNSIFVQTLLIEDTFTSTFDNLATAIATKLATIKAALETNESAEILGMRINTIGNVKPSHCVVIDSTTDLLSLIIDWQGFSYSNNIVQAIDIVNKKMLSLTMTNDTNNDGFISYFEDSTAYTFTIEYRKYKKIVLT